MRYFCAFTKENKMKSILFILTISLGMIACQSSNSETTETPAAADSKATASAPLTSIQWIDTIKQFGKIQEGEKIILGFRFKNTGNAPLIIETVNPGCGCTVAERPEAPIAPGGEGEIKAAFDSKGRPGATYKTMEVTCNTEQGRYTLVFEGEVVPKQ